MFYNNNNNNNKRKARRNSCSLSLHSEKGKESSRNKDNRIKNGTKLKKQTNKQTR